MSCTGEEREYGKTGAIEPRICAALAGVGAAQIDQWREAGLLPGALWNDEAERDFPEEPDWFYSWDDLHRILAAAKLIELGLPAERIPEIFARFNEACQKWATKLAVDDLEPIFPAEVGFHRFIAERWHERELGRLWRFADAIHVDPHIHEGLPVIRGRRVDTRTIYGFHVHGDTIEEIADDFLLTPHLARRAIEFEREVLKADETLSGAAAAG